jgi:hypothetical protein
VTREPQEPLVHGGEVDGDLRLDRLAGVGAAVELHTEFARAADGIRRFGGGDETLGRHDVGDDGGAANACAFDQGDVRAELRTREGGLIAARATSEYSDPLFALELVGHYSIVAVRKTVAKTGGMPGTAISRGCGREGCPTARMRQSAAGKVKWGREARPAE